MAVWGIIVISRLVRSRGVDRFRGSGVLLLLLVSGGERAVFCFAARAAGHAALSPEAGAVGHG